MTANSIVTITGLNKWYGDFHVLRDINLDVAKGERIVICGPSGSGKSTLIRCINALEEFQEGEIVVDGIDLTNLSLSGSAGGSVSGRVSLDEGVTAPMPRVSSRSARAAWIRRRIRSMPASAMSRAALRVPSVHSRMRRTRTARASRCCARR